MTIRIVIVGTGFVANLPHPQSSTGPSPMEGRGDEIERDDEG
jgi:hypothetical protein